MPNALVKRVKVPGKPTRRLRSTAPDGSQVWEDYKWDPGKERWVPMFISEPAPPRPPIPPTPVRPFVPRTPVIRIPLPGPPTVRGTDIPYDQLMKMSDAYWAAVNAWLATNPGKSLLDYLLEN